MRAKALVIQKFKLPPVETDSETWTFISGQHIRRRQTVETQIVQQQFSGGPRHSDKTLSHGAQRQAIKIALSRVEGGHCVHLKNEKSSFLEEKTEVPLGGSNCKHLRWKRRQSFKRSVLQIIGIFRLMIEDSLF